mgnify:CR=1 FL=1
MLSNKRNWIFLLHIGKKGRCNQYFFIKQSYYQFQSISFNIYSNSLITSFLRLEAIDLRDWPVISNSTECLSCFWAIQWKLLINLFLDFPQLSASSTKSLILFIIVPSFNVDSKFWYSKLAFRWSLIFLMTSFFPSLVILKAEFPRFWKKSNSRHQHLSNYVHLSRSLHCWCL